MNFSGILQRYARGSSSTADRRPRLIAGLHEYFRYHGLLAPGVRLLRALPFSYKAAVVAGAFLLPLVLVSSHYVDLTLNMVRHEARSRMAMNYVDHVDALTRALQQARLLSYYQSQGGQPPADVSAELPVGAVDVSARWAALRAHDAEVRRELGNIASFTPLQSCMDELSAADAATTLPLWRRQSLCILKLLALSRQVVQSSHVQPRGDMAIAHLQLVVLDELPHLKESLLGLRGISTLVWAGQGDDWAWLKAGERSALADDTLDRLRTQLDAQRGLHPALARLQALPLWDRIEALLRSPVMSAQGEASAEARQAWRQQVTALVGEIEQAETLGQQLLAEAMDASGRRLVQDAIVLASLVALLVTLAIYLLLAFYRVMSGGLGALQAQVARMASGDLSARPQPWGRDEVALAMYSLGTSLSRLADLFAAVRQGVAAVSHASREIASGNQDLTQRTERSADAISQVLQGVTRYTDQLDECGQQIDRAVEVVEAMRLDAARSRTRMDKLDERMRSLKGKSHEIGEIVELIDNIAFRTNILALNASVEAAKAGEAGRGFAVVATEVRSLAQRSAESARRISDIIGRSTDDIAHGSALTGLVVESLQSTDAHVQRIHETMQEIVALTRAGQQNSQNILIEIRGLSEVTQENTNLVGQMEAASHALSEQGDHLREKVSTFKLT
ncbi:methyl-accepting chemotaxis protein [Sphaerotilus hippei]|uniref:Methyl-accepting chemotaxis protein n=1 Tax=Sphaerotilus hippei TaxID=744406 RepID=A0A318GZ06_9BURK|nr:methyl-accepting chemotaxis protein [Sphaerotilus hippei]PXW95497.1 methyl-accepting chemotaxis protein [Sphaerotilus hippei]